MSDKDFINSILVDENVDDDTASFLLKYISSWINDKGIDINTDTIKKMNENKDKINWYENFEINKTIDKLRIKHNNQQKEFIEWLENEEDRLARECSHMYKNSLGKTRLVNEDIFNEVDTILSKYKEIIGDDK